MPLSLVGMGGALGIGLALGLLGSGGSIITVPVLVYLFGQGEKEAIAGSLIVVAVIASFGALAHARAGAVVPRIVAAFGPAGMLGAWLGATASRYVSGAVQLTVFAVAMLGAATMMLFPPRRLIAGESSQARTRDLLAAKDLAMPITALILVGLAVGLLTGFVGVGGGFLIVPALVLAARLPMHQAIGTSLTLIALNAFAGFAKHLALLASQGEHLAGSVLAVVTILGIGGSILGQRFGSRLPAAALRRSFGGALIVLAIFMLWHNSY